MHAESSHMQDSRLSRCYREHVSDTVAILAQGMSKSRKHYSGDLEKLANALGKHVGDRGLSDIVKKPGKVENRQQRQKRLIKDRELYQVLATLCDNLTFTESMFKKAIKTMAAVKDWSSAGTEWVSSNKHRSTTLRVVG